MNTKPSICRIRPVLITVRLTVVAAAIWAAPTAAYDWRIDSISVKPKLLAAEGTILTIECPWSRSGSPSDETSGSVQILHSYKESVNFGIKSIKLSPSSSGGTISAQWVAQDMGNHTIACEVGFAGKDPLYKSKEPDYANNKKSVVVQVAKKITDTKWPTAPIIVTPGQNQKVSGGNIVVKPYNPWLSHCADGGYISLDWQYLDKATSTWKPIKLLSKLWKCVPEGSKKDISGMKPGLYKVRAMESNGKYNFKSDWSAWVTFELVK